METDSQILELCWRAGQECGDDELQQKVELARTCPSDPFPLYALAERCRAIGKEHLWREGVALAMTLDHVTHRHIYHRGVAKLLLGDWSGWVDLEARRHRLTSDLQTCAHARRRNWERREWNGIESLQGKVLFVAAEQGFGDMIQMLRFTSPIAAQARQVILTTQPSLLTFAQHNLGHVADVTFRDIDLHPQLGRGVHYDLFVWAMSLPALVGQLPPFVPMTAPRPDKPATCVGRPKRGGICWSGNPKYANDARRSMPLSVLAPILDRSDVCWHSLQMETSVDTAKVSDVVERDAPFQSFSDTANYIAGLDLIITVDTAVAHLSGSLGKPTLLLLPYASTPRWGMGNSTPWYPSMRLIRQRSPGDWPSVVTQVQSQLDRWDQDKRDGTPQRD